MPAEWEAHQGMLMEWPVSGSDWGDDINLIWEVFANVASAIAEFEPVFLLATGEDLGTARKMCGESVTVLEMEHDDCWMRDNGPTFVFEEFSHSLTGLSWDFNAWGLKHPNYALDNRVPEKLCELCGVPLTKPGIVLEGGSIHTNGRGTLLATEECLLNENRNPSMRKGGIEEVLKEYLGVQRVFWLPFGLCDDETDGHVDNVCCFIDENTVATPWTDDQSDPNRSRLVRNREELQRGGFSVETLPQPGLTMYDGFALAKSYVNFAFINGGIVMPVFGGDDARTDEMALGKMRELFPRREVISLQTLPILKGGGNIHCITQQIPRMEGYSCAKLP
jgi:agmatine deiminase